MKIDAAEVHRIAQLAHLETDPTHLDRIAGELTAILEYIDQLREVDVTVQMHAGPVVSTPMRDDEPAPNVVADAAESNAPEFAHGFFIVPRVIGGE